MCLCFSEIDFMLLTPPATKVVTNHAYTDPLRYTKTIDIGRLCLSEKKKPLSFNVNVEKRYPPKVYRQPGPLIKETSAAPNLPLKERMGWMKKLQK